jgi:hypothetical protein
VAEEQTTTTDEEEENAMRLFCSLRRLLRMEYLLAIALTYQCVSTFFYQAPHTDPHIRTLTTNNRPLEADPDAFSACLLVMDDNHRLPEWLAYHYTVMPLRTLIIAVDPHSKTSPIPVLNEWKDRIQIQVWTNDVFTDNDFKREEGDTIDDLHAKHMERQRIFYKVCSRQLQQGGYSWTTYHDTDEYVAISQHIIPDAAQRLSRPGSVLRFLREIMADVNGTIPQSHKHFQNRTCITLPRGLYSAVESTDDEVNMGVPVGIDARRLDTLRFRYRAYNRTYRTGLGKSIIDVSRIPPHLLEGDFRAGSAHLPIRKVCPSAYVDYVLPLGVHHYVGGAETVFVRDDARQTRKTDQWEGFASRQDGGADDEIRPWLQAFIDLVGLRQAKFLLRNAGVVSKVAAGS